MSEELALLCVSLVGALLGCSIALVPGLHVFNVAGIALLLYTQSALVLSERALALFLLGALVGWSVVSVILAVFLFAPDDAHAPIVLPATKYLLRGRGLEAALLTGSGSLGALLGLVLLSPILDEIVRPLRTILQPHTGWMLVAIIAFLLLGEWPRADDLAPRRCAGCFLRGLISVLGYLRLR
jgi:putative membrane protein